MNNSGNVISIESIGKCYHIYQKPRDRLIQMISRGKRKLHTEFWALKDVSFSVKKGETLAIIGCNGSGKSTLLQIICGTLNQTEGNVSVNGKIAALLELGAGFNPEFSGKENVYMSCALYGLTPHQIHARYQQIIDFADIGDHIDQPVKTYSSGMYVRLAFSVIAHVDADILVIDEALAVGDAVFTQRCMRFIRRFQQTGTLIFVSHDMGSVLNLCKRAVWLNQGKIQAIGEAKDIAEQYLQFTLQEVYGEETRLNTLESVSRSDSNSDTVSVHTSNPNAIGNYYGSCFDFVDNINEANGWKTGAGEITKVLLENLDNDAREVFLGGERIKLKISARLFTKMENPIIGFLFRDRLGQDLFGENTLPFTDKNVITVSENNTIEANFIFTLPMLPNGKYTVMISLADGDLYTNVQHHWLHDAIVVTVSSSKVRWGLVGVEFHDVSLEKK